MSKIDLQLPTIQNWSCEGCGQCCRQHLIAITEAERDRIVKQNWQVSDGIADPANVVEPIRGARDEYRFRLAHQPDGACVFLDERGLCRIHAKFGEPAKPLACRVYPYAFHPAGKKIAIGLRFSCPTVVGNRGKSVASQSKDLQELARQVVPADYQLSRVPAIAKGESLEWPDLLRIVRGLDESFADSSVPFPLQLLRAVNWVDLLSQARFEKIRGARLDELVDLLRESAVVEYESFPPTGVKPVSRLGRVMFRLLLSIYGRKETQEELDRPIRSRWLSLRSTTRFAWGGGKTPQLHQLLPRVAFRDVERGWGALPAEADAMFSRYFRMKIQGMHFCGAAYYDFPLTTGFFSLTLMFPVIVWLGRWIALGNGRTEMTQADLELAMTIADHHHGYSPVLGLAPFRKRVEYLHRLGDLPRLIVHYSR